MKLKLTFCELLLLPHASGQPSHVSTQLWGTWLVWMSSGPDSVHSQHVQRLSAAADVWVSPDVCLSVFSVMARAGSFSPIPACLDQNFCKVWQAVESEEQPLERESALGLVLEELK